FRDALPTGVQVCDVKAANGDLRRLRSVFPGRQYLPSDGFVLHHCFASAIAGRNRKLQPAGWNNSNFRIREFAARRATTRTKVRRAAFSRNSPVLEDMDRKIEIQGPLARNGSPLGLDAEVAHQPGTRIINCGTHVFAAREDWWSSQLGLSLHLVAGCQLHALRLDSARLCRRSEGVHRMAKRTVKRRRGARAIASRVWD